MIECERGTYQKPENLRWLIDKVGNLASAIQHNHPKIQKISCVCIVVICQLLQGTIFRKTSGTVPGLPALSGIQ